MNNGKYPFACQGDADILSKTLRRHFPEHHISHHKYDPASGFSERNHILLSGYQKFWNCRNCWSSIPIALSVASVFVSRVSQRFRWSMCLRYGLCSARGGGAIIGGSTCWCGTLSTSSVGIPAGTNFIKYRHAHFDDSIDFFIIHGTSSQSTAWPQFLRRVMKHPAHVITAQETSVQMSHSKTMTTQTKQRMQIFFRYGEKITFLVSFRTIIFGLRGLASSVRLTPPNSF